MPSARHPRTAALTLATTLASALTTACATPHTYSDSATTPWREPPSYTYTLTADTQILSGTFHLTVHHLRVTTTPPHPSTQLPTIGTLLTRLRTARHHHADTADIAYAPDGRPTRIVLDEDRNAVDDEETYLITAFRLAPG
ncbi:DUF6174 domain-containing protein [Streptomyces sp. NPDC004539]|uniref:DUF6174 domain-containing protein n=1 Tax=Streptomyces sp. NPDC004539 TaxID=3154280 RepID=UPI0033B845C9